MDTSIVLAIIAAAVPGVLSFIIAMVSGVKLKNKADASESVVNSAMKIVEQLQEECAMLKTEIKTLEKESAAREARIKTLEGEKEELRRENKELREVVEQLRARIKGIEANGKNNQLTD